MQKQEKVFRNFSNYIRLIENTGAHLNSGIAKIVPPKGWNPRPSKNGNYDDAENYVIYEWDCFCAFGF